MRRHLVKIIVLLGFIGWAGIVDYAVERQDARLETMCSGYPNCFALASGARDATLIAGLTVALVAAIIVGLIWARALPSPSIWRRSAKPAEPTRLR